MKVINTYQHDDLCNKLKKGLEESLLLEKKKMKELETTLILQKDKTLLEEVYNAYRQKLQEIQQLMEQYNELFQQTRVYLRRQQLIILKKKQEEGSES